MNDLLTLGEACTLLGTTKSHVLQLVDNNTFTRYQDENGNHYFNLLEVARVIAGQRDYYRAKLA